MQRRHLPFKHPPFPMPVERYFIPSPLMKGVTQILQDSEFHHLARVMRTRVGEQIELVNGQGALAQAVVQDIGKDRATVRIESVQEVKARSQRVILAQAIPKPNRLDFILEKGTELGVDEFWLFPGQLSVKKDFNEHQLERLRLQMIAAMKQCGRLYVPELKIQPPLVKWPKIEGVALYGDLEEKAPLFSKIWPEIKDCSRFTFFIGPESGFTNGEVDFLQKKGARGVKLHPNILRTDTAALVALSLLEHALLDR